MTRLSSPAPLPFPFAFTVPMYSPSPRKTLLLLWGVAALILIGGIRLARQEKQVRVDRDREALRFFAKSAQAQFQRLEDLYEDHLVRLGQDVVPNAMESGRMADRIIGILQVTLLHTRGSGMDDFHTIVNAAPDRTMALPVFEIPAYDAGAVVLLDETRVFTRASGWIDEPGKPLMFCARRSASEVAVLTVSREAVAESIEGWLRQWAAKSFGPVRVTGGPDQLRGGGVILAATGEASSDEPDLILPLRSRFGTFDVASWDVRKTATVYHPATLAASAALAVMIALLGVVVFIEQRKAHAAASQRVSFVNRVSHDLRTPLTNIMLNIDLAMEMTGEEPEEANRRLGLVRIEARRLGRLIENVLTFSRTEEGKMQVEARACVPAGIISSVIEQFLPSFQRRGLMIERVDAHLDEACLCDADALAQILGNLLSNVEKYVPGGVVEIAGTWESGELTISITDEGPGIPADEAERIFRPFERLHSKINEGASGTGLGLAIARDLATRLGGTLRLLPAVSGSGCCFELRLPAPAVTPEPTA